MKDKIVWYIAVFLLASSVDAVNFRSAKIGKIYVKISKGIRHVSVGDAALFVERASLFFALCVYELKCYDWLHDFIFKNQSLGDSPSDNKPIPEDKNFDFFDTCFNGVDMGVAKEFVNHTLSFIPPLILTSVPQEQDNSHQSMVKVIKKLMDLKKELLGQQELERYHGALLFFDVLVVLQHYNIKKSQDDSLVVKDKNFINFFAAYILFLQYNEKIKECELSDENYKISYEPSLINILYNSKKSIGISESLLGIKIQKQEFIYGFRKAFVDVKKQ